MGLLDTKQRKKLPVKDFSGPDRSYPVENKAHAVDAKAMATRFASPAVKKKVDAKANKVIKGKGC